MMELLVLAMIFGLVPAVIARDKGQSFGGWWIYGAVIFPVAVVHSLLLKSDRRRRRRRSAARQSEDA